MIKKVFDVYEGEEVLIYTVKSEYLEADILTFGATVHALRVKDKRGGFTDVALGYTKVSDHYDKGGYLGAIVGRVGNRIDKGRFSLNGKVYQVGINDGNNSLHGGIKGFDKKNWTVEYADERKIILSTFSPDGEEGYPAGLIVRVTYEITAEKGLKISYEGVADGDTVVSLTNHTYFNLNGEGKGDILSHKLFIQADEITPVDGELIPHGDFMKVENTPFDFRTPKLIGRDIEKDDPQLKNCGGYDVNFVLSGKGFRKVAEAEGNESGIKMSVYTDREGVQFYSGNVLNGERGKTSAHKKRGAFCLETQSFPNAVNCPEYPSVALKKGEKYKTTTEYRFSL